LEISLLWLVRNFKNQSIDGCLLTSFAMLCQELEEQGFKLAVPELDRLAAELINRYNTANNAQLEIKKACLLLNKNRPGYTALDPNYVVSNGLKHIARSIGIQTTRDQLAQWEVGF
jgi:hypothetical protein